MERKTSGVEMTEAAARVAASGAMAGPEGTVPPLPDTIDVSESVPGPTGPGSTDVERLPDLLPRPPVLKLRWLRAGCYLIRYTPRLRLPAPRFYPLWHYDGTLRVTRHHWNTTASGDLYLHRLPAPWVAALPIEPDPGAGIPIFARRQYSYYVRVTRVLEVFTWGNSFTLGFQLHRFDHATETWGSPKDYTAVMEWKTAPPGYPSPGDYLEGDVKNASGAVVGRLTMGWVSPYLRRATVEIDKASASEWPLDNAAGLDWAAILKEVGWDVKAVASNGSVPEPSGESWSDGELHNGMLTWRGSADLDTQWLYHLMCVRRLDSTSRGIMYDAYGGDSNNIPREGAAIASHWVFPNSDPWGKCKNVRFGQATAPYFRTAVHEIGHAMLLYHPGTWLGNHLMQVTPNIANNAVPPEEFPDNIEWSFAPEDQKLLQHLPDMAVRPGGIPFGVSHSAIPISPDDAIADAEGIELNVTGLRASVPIGAPVRVNIELANTTGTPVPVPADLGMKAGHVTGEVVDPSGTVRTFSPIVRYLDEVQLQDLAPDQTVSSSLTLLRGPRGALFPAPGVHRVLVRVTWEIDGCPFCAQGETNVMVTPPVDEEHAEAALKILSTPDTLLSLAVGGDHLEEGNEATQAGLDHPMLRPHFAFVEAKRLGRRYGKRKPDLKGAAGLLDEETVMSPAEVKSAAKWVQAAADEAPKATVKAIAKTLKTQADQTGADDETAGILDEL